MAKILLVEDDTNLSEIYQARLEAEGYIVVAAADGETALALAAKERPDLILSDVMMPKISGFEMLDILRNTEGLKHTKVIMLTALGQAEDKTRAEQLGADRYLVKSQVTLEDIVTAAHDLLVPEEDGGIPTPEPPTTPAAASPIPAAPVTPVPLQAAPTGPLESTPIVAAPAPTAMPVAVQPMPVVAPSAPADPTVPLAVAAVAPTPPVVAPSPLVPELATLAEPVITPVPPAASFDFAQPTAAAPVAPPVVAITTVNDADPVPAVIDTSALASVPAPEPSPALDFSVSPAPPAPNTNGVTIKAAQSAFQTSPNPAAIDESVVANAIDKLLAKTPAAAGGTSAALSPDSPTERVHKKIISPIERPGEPSLQELLAKEEAKSTPTTVNIAPSNPAVAVPTPVATATASPALDPDAALLAQAQQEKANHRSAETVFDPNNIAL